MTQQATGKCFNNDTTEYCEELKEDSKVEKSCDKLDIILPELYQFSLSIIQENVYFSNNNDSYLLHSPLYIPPRFL